MRRSSFLVRIEGARDDGPALITIEGDTFFLARAAAAVRFKIDPDEIRPALRFTMAKS